MKNWALIASCALFGCRCPAPTTRAPAPVPDPPAQQIAQEPVEEPAPVDEPEPVEDPEPEPEEPAPEPISGRLIVEGIGLLVFDGVRWQRPFADFVFCGTGLIQTWGGSFFLEAQSCRWPHEPVSWKGWAEWKPLSGEVTALPIPDPERQRPIARIPEGIVLSTLRPITEVIQILDEKGALHRRPVKRARNDYSFLEDGTHYYLFTPQLGGDEDRWYGDLVPGAEMSLFSKRPNQKPKRLVQAGTVMQPAWTANGEAIVYWLPGVPDLEAETKTFRLQSVSVTGETRDLGTSVGPLYGRRFGPVYWTWEKSDWVVYPGSTLPPGGAEMTYDATGAPSWVPPHAYTVVNVLTGESKPLELPPSWHLVQDFSTDGYGQPGYGYAIASTHDGTGRVRVISIPELETVTEAICPAGDVYLGTYVHDPQATSK